MGKIFIIMGKSGVGKDTIFKSLIEKHKDKFKTVTLYTTRPKREGETEGVEYYFVDSNKLSYLKETKKIIERREYKTIHGIWTYFTVEDGQINLEKQDYIMIGTLETYKSMRTYFGIKQVIPIYIEVEDGLRLERILKREQQEREPKYKEMCRRFLADSADFSEQNLKKLGILKRYENITINDCIKQIEKDIVMMYSI